MIFQIYVVMIFQQSNRMNFLEKTGGKKITTAYKTEKLKRNWKSKNSVYVDIKYVETKGGRELIKTSNKDDFFFLNFC